MNLGVSEQNTDPGRGLRTFSVKRPGPCISQKRSPVSSNESPLPRATKSEHWKSSVGAPVQLQSSPLITLARAAAAGVPRGLQVAPTGRLEAPRPLGVYLGQSGDEDTWGQT